jgi:enoyl-CoA hydratase
MELRLAARFFAGHDFIEGIRAAVIDKDRSPRWVPSSLAEVGSIAPFFAELPDGIGG